MDSRTAADAGDYINCVMKEGIWSMKHCDVQTEEELKENCELFCCQQSKEALLAAVAAYHGLDVRLMDMLLMCAHLHREMIMTLQGTLTLTLTLTLPPSPSPSPSPSQDWMSHTLVTSRDVVSTIPLHSLSKKFTEPCSWTMMAVRDGRRHKLT